SNSTLEDAIRAARRNGVVVYAIALGDARRGPLQRLARATGGAVYPSPTPAQLQTAYEKIGRELVRTWRMSYTTAARPGDDIRVSGGAPGGPSETVAIPGQSTRPKGGLLPSAVVSGTEGLILLALLVATLVFLAVRRAQKLPRAARIKRIVHQHTDP